MSPANFAATNPDVLKLALESKGESVKAGVANLLEDLKRGRLSITDETAFEVGKNVATSASSGRWLTHSADRRTAPSRGWLVRFAWLGALWTIGVATVGFAAWLPRLVMHAVGLVAP